MNHRDPYHKALEPPAPSAQVKLRLPLALKTWLQGRAAAARRSLSAEIELRLEESHARQEKGLQ